MKILFLTPSFPPMVGGGESYAGALADQLLARGHELTVLTSSATRQEEFWQGTDTCVPPAPDTSRGPNYRIIRCPVQPMPMGRTGLSLWRKAMVLLSALQGDQRQRLESMARRVPGIVFDDGLKQIGHVDIIHAFNISWEYPLAVAAALAQKRDVPLVITPFAHLGSNRPRDRVALNNTMQHQLDYLRNADAVLALTSVERDGLGARGIDAARIHVLPAGLDRSDALGTFEKGSMPRPSERRYVCFVGRNSRNKGAVQSLQAIVDVLRQGLCLDLVMVGPRDATFEQQVARLPKKVRAHIHVLGVVDEATKQACIAQSEMLVLPSRVDSFGIVILEAWQHGRPVIGARSGGIPGLIRENVDGLLVEHGNVDALADRIVWLLRNQEAAQRMGRQGQRRLGNEFDWDNLGQRLVTLYEQLGDASEHTSTHAGNI